jgi:hypothetical protein
MKVVDFGAYIVVYNFIIGVLMMGSSEKFGTWAGWLYQPRRATIARYTQISAFTFGASVSVVAGFVYVVFHTLKIGL